MKNDQPIKVLIATPSYDGKFDVRYLNSLFETQKIAPSHNIQLLPYFLCYDSLIQRARNDYFRTAFQSGVDVLFFIDSDIGWNPEDFVKIVKSQYDVIGASYRKKTNNEELYAFKAKEVGQNDFKLTPDSNGILEVSGLGFGFIKFSKSAVKALWDSEKNFYGGKTTDTQFTKNICECIINSDNDFVSEDIIVGFKWAGLGNKTYLDTTIDLIHSGNAEYTGDISQWLANWRITIDKKLGRTANNDESVDQFIAAQATKPVESTEEDDIFKIL